MLLLFAPIGAILFVYIFLLLTCVQLFVAPWTVARQAPLFMELSRQEYWSRLPFPTSENLPDPGTESASLSSPALAGRFLTARTTWEAILLCWYHMLESSLLPLAQWWQM